MRQRAEEVLARSGWLSEQAEGFRAELLQRSLVLEFAAGSAVYRLHDPPGGIYGLASGVLAVGFGGGDAGPHILPFGAAGDWIGVVPFLTGGPRLAEVRAVSDCFVMHLPLPGMEAMAARDPAAARAFAQIAVANIETLMQFLRILVLPGSERRVAAALLQAARCGADPLPLSQADLACFANSSLRQVSVAMRAFCARGLVETGYRSIRILDASGLGAIAWRHAPVG